MRSHADVRPHRTDGRSAGIGGRPVEGRAAEPAKPARAVPATARPPLVTPTDVSAMQRIAGNRATVQALRSGVVVQRALSVDQAEAIARRLEDAMAGWGTDEEAIYGALAGRTPTDYQAIKEAYAHLYHGKNLDAELADELTESEMARVRQELASTREAGGTEGQQTAARGERARAVAVQLRDAMAGWGTEEDQIFNALEGRSPAELNEVSRQYADLTGRNLEQDLVDELSGDDLRRALGLLGVVRTDVFSNEITQHMTEGATTVVEGRFEWALTRDEMRVQAGVKFVPDQGVTPPYSEWNNQIATTWNKFAVVEPGGRKLPINLSIRPDPGNDRTLAVHANTNPARWWEDRADAGNWYVKMTPDTAPHEFGHLIGLEDEYQRTHGDIARITGAAPAAGVTNASGKTPEQVAGELHTALTGDPRAQRAAKVTTSLKAVGLIDADGVPQQGDFAQSVKTAYDKAHTPNLVDTMRDNLDKEGRWAIQTVFSYATRTVMGNPEALSKGGVANQPHDHGVLPRHLAEFARLVKGVWPQFDWTIGPR